MNVNQFAAQMRVTIEEIKSGGKTALTCDEIIAYLRNIEKSADTETSALDMERFKANLQNRHEIKLEKFRTIIDTGQNAIRSSFLLNGGGVIALLAFITHLAEFRAEKVPEFADCLLPFALGVFAVTMTSCFTYLTQWSYGHDEPWGLRAGYRFRIFVILFGIGSYLLFIYGVLLTYWAFVEYNI